MPTGRASPASSTTSTSGLGLAVDQEKSDGSRTLLVPCIKDADTLDFRSFVLAYEDLIRKIHTNKIAPDDFAGTTVSLTNPGTLGTVQSVPRLMPGPGRHHRRRARSAIRPGSRRPTRGWWPSWAWARWSRSPRPTTTASSRGPSRACSSARVAALLTGADGFYDDLFESMGVPYEPVRWQVDNNAGDGQRGRASTSAWSSRCTCGRSSTCTGCVATSSPTSTPSTPSRPHIHPELDPLTYGLTIWDLPRHVRRRRPGRARRGHARRDPPRAARRLLPDARHRVHAHPGSRAEALDPSSTSRASRPRSTLEEQRHILDRLNAAEVFERFLHTRYVGQKRFGLEGAESTIVLLDALLDSAAGSGVAEVVMGMAHRGRLNVLANIVGKSYREIFEEFEGNLDPESVQGSGDVKYHKGARGVFHGERRRGAARSPWRRTPRTSRRSTPWSRA